MFTFHVEKSYNCYTSLRTVLDDFLSTRMIQIPSGMKPALIHFRSVFSGSDLDRKLVGRCALQM